MKHVSKKFKEIAKIYDVGVFCIKYLIHLIPLVKEEHWCCCQRRQPGDVEKQIDVVDDLINHQKEERVFKARIRIALFLAAHSTALILFFLNLILKESL